MNEENFRRAFYAFFRGTSAEVGLGTLAQKNLSIMPARQPLNRGVIVGEFLQAHGSLLMWHAKEVIRGIQGEQQLRALQALGEKLNTRIVWPRTYFNSVERLAGTLCATTPIRVIIRDRAGFVLGTDADQTQLELSQNGNGRDPYRSVPEPELNGTGPAAPADNISPCHDVHLTDPTMIYLPATSRFTMGSTKSGDEQPVRENVKISAFKMSQDPITNSQYAKSRGEEFTDSAKANHPVVNVSWLDAIKYCNWLSGQKGKQEVYEIRGEQVIWHRDKIGVRLPTEAEWEYAARDGEDKGENREFPYGNKFDGSKTVSSASQNNVQGTEAVNSETNKKGATPKGIRGLSGNVWEWCWDKWENKYDGNALDNPIGPGGTTASAISDPKIMRGGSWGRVPDGLRGANRGVSLPGYGLDDVGFRVVEDLFI